MFSAVFQMQQKYFIQSAVLFTRCFYLLKMLDYRNTFIVLLDFKKYMILNSLTENFAFLSYSTS